VLCELLYCLSLRRRRLCEVIVSSSPDQSCILTVNGGSSSLKFAVFEAGGAPGDRPRRALSGRIERIGLADAQAKVSGADGQSPAGWNVEAPNLSAAADVVIGWLDERLGGKSIAAIGHRVVHGGPRYARPEPVTDELLAELRRIAPFDPEHLPGEIAVIERFAQKMPDVPQVACFDTAFHRDIPRVARIVPLPRRYEPLGMRRYGFHGLSYMYLLEELGRVAGTEAAQGRLVLAHLGAGASLAAVHNGKCVETTMGFTPASGLVMGTRTGDIDPCLPWFLARAAGVTPDQFYHMANHKSGLLGVSETSPDLRDLRARQDHDVRAAEAVELFVYQVKKAIGALTAVLGGLDILVFSAGIGENSPETRASVCAGLGFLGVELDQRRNAANAPLISTDQARVSVRVIRTDEEVVIARATAKVVGRTRQENDPRCGFTSSG
jgi:acetate kinase